MKRQAVLGAGLTSTTGDACILVLALGVIVLAWSSPVLAQEEPTDAQISFSPEVPVKPRDKRCSPDVPDRCVPSEPTLIPRDARWNVGGALGSCLRDDTLVGGAGLCGEVHVGGAFLLRHGRSERTKWRIAVELGLGFLPSKSVGYSDLGLSESAGGAYVVPRISLAYHWSPLFFTDFGAQTRIGNALGLWTWSVQGVIELGTSVLYPNIEIGIRELLGSDVVASTAPGVSSSTTQVFGASTVGFVRLLLP